MMADILHYEFLKNAVLAGILASIICGIIGSYIVVRRIVFLSGGISHAAFGGIGIGYYFGFDPIYGAVGFSVISAVIVGAVKKYSSQSEDTTIGVLWAFGMAVGILFVSLTPGYAPDLFSYLFGNILTVPKGDIYLMLFFALIIILIVLCFYNDIVALSFDEEYAKIQGRPVNLFYFLMLGLVGLTIVTLIKIVGIILVISLLTIPPAISIYFSKSLGSMMISASIIAAIFTLAGLYFSYMFNLQSGATIILTASAGYFLLLILKHFIKKGVKKTHDGNS